MWAALVLTVACATFARAQTTATSDPADLTGLSLDQLLDADVVYAASKRIQSLREAPSAVSVVTAAEIRQHGYRTLADVLRTLPGFYVTDDRNYSYVGVRGFDRPGDYSTRVLLLINGLRTNDNVYDQAFVGNEFPLDLDLVDRVEVVRGPSAAIYGNSAFFAVVNVVTKHGHDFQGGEVSASGGSFGAFGGRATYGRKLDSGIELLLSASASESRGQRLFYPEFDRPDTHQGVADRLDGEQVQRVFASVSKGSLSFEASHVARDKGVPTASFGTLFGDPRTRTVDVKDAASLTFERSSGKGTSIMGRVHYGSWNYDGTYGYAEPDTHLNRDSGRGKWWGFEGSVARTVAGRHLVTLGGEFQDNFQQDQKNFDDVTPRLTYQDSHQDSERWALFVQDEVRLGEKGKLYLGLRHDQYETFRHQTSPRVGLIYNLTPATTVKVLHGRAFRAPNAFELYYIGVGYKTNSSLGPETIQTTELVVERTLGPGVRLTASGYLTRIQDLITLERDPADDLLRFQNAGMSDALGAEFGLEVKRSRGPSGRVSYSLQRSHDHYTGQPLTNSPRHMAKLNLVVPLLARRLSAALDTQYLSARQTLAGGQADGFLLANVTLLAARIGGRVDISGSVSNVLGTRYADPGSEEHVQDLIPQDGRSFHLKLAWRF